MSYDIVLHWHFFPLGSYVKVGFILKGEKDMLFDEYTDAPLAWHAWLPAKYLRVNFRSLLNTLKVMRSIFLFI